MAWKLDSDRPIYTQLLEQIQMRIVSGHYPAGYRLPSVRELAAEAGVNPNTVQKALAELEQRGLLRSQRTAGRYVTEDTEFTRRIRQTLAQEALTCFFQNMRRLGYEETEILSFLKAACEED